MVTVLRKKTKRVCSTNWGEIQMKRPTYEDYKEIKYQRNFMTGMSIMLIMLLLAGYFGLENNYKSGKEAGYNQCMNESKQLIFNNQGKLEIKKEANKNLKVLEDNSKEAGNLYIGTFNFSEKRGSWIFENRDGSKIEIENTCEGNQTFKINSTFIGCVK